MFNLLVAGCGYIGSEVARKLAAAGHRVTALRRRPPEPGAIDGIRWVAADLSVPSSLAAIPADIDGVFFTAAVSRAAGDAPEAIYHHGLRNLVNLFQQRGQPLRRFLATSSTGVYGQMDGSWIDEDSPTGTELPGGQAMLAGEAVLVAAPWSTVVVRFSGIYGPGRIRMLRQVQGERPVIAATEHIWLNQVHRDDCVGALLHLWELEVPPPVVLASDHQPATRFEVLSWLAAATGAPPPRIDATGPPPARLRGNKRVDASRLRATGYTFRYPTYRHGYRDLL